MSSGLSADSSPVRIAVVGVGAFGKNHARNLEAIPAADLIAVVDPDRERCQDVAAEYGTRALFDYRELIGQVDAAVVAAPTAFHTEIGVALLEAGVDVLIEKPLAPDLDSADRLIAAAEAGGRILQVGHLERFNPIVQEAFRIAELPLFFEVHRLSTFSPRSLDVDVLLDLMIHDLDILLSLVHSEIDRIEASGIPILSEQPDIASVRIVFENGCVANLTASRISTEKIRKLRFFQPRQYVSIDYARKDGVKIGLDETGRLQYEQLKPDPAEPLRAELEAFLESVRTRRPPLVDGSAGRRALAAALRIRAEMERHAALVQATVAAHQK
ncbi:MAG: gfo/Idh/MocA family oxidoreductase [Acidobacteria bacterium]|nr:gfo/Idh/MocA family oxidoreductase [Acidobacteriota bacterium]